MQEMCVRSSRRGPVNDSYVRKCSRHCQSMIHMLESVQDIAHRCFKGQKVFKTLPVEDSKVGKYSRH